MFLIRCLMLNGCDKSSDWSDKDVNYLITQLKSNRSYFKRDRAIRWLEEKGQERDKVIPALTHALLNDEYKFVRVSAVRALGRMNPPAISAIPALAEALQREDTGKVKKIESRDLNLHRQVVEALGNMGAEALPTLMLALHSSNLEAWPYAAEKICRIDPAMQNIVFDTIVEKLSHEDANTRYRAISVAEDIYSLQGIDDSLLKSAFTKILNDASPYVRSRAIEALENVKNIEE